jgi:signal transduction histidine kinase
MLLPTLHSAAPDPESERIRRTLALFDRQLHQATNITTNLLESARAEAGHLELRPGRVDMGHVAREAVELACVAHPSHHVELAQPPEPIEVGADAVRLQQVLDNLLQNAIKYSPEGSRVRVTLSADEREAAISVADEGGGIPAEDLPLVFDPFFRSKSAGDAPGTGLGLSVARQIVAAHGGRIDVQSQPGHGSTFTVVLPRALQRPGSV